MIHLAWWAGGTEEPSCAHCSVITSCTTSVQLNIANPRAGDITNAKIANQGLIVEYMDRARGYTM